MVSLPLVKNIVMASAAARTLKQAIKPHVPLIKFPSRGDLLKPVPGGQAQAGKQDSVNSLLVSTMNPSSATTSGKTKASVSSSSAIDSSQLPSKYHRKRLSNEEMEYIEKGGLV